MAKNIFKKLEELERKNPKIVNALKSMEREKVPPGLVEAVKRKLNEIDVKEEDKIMKTTKRRP